MIPFFRGIKARQHLTIRLLEDISKHMYEIRDNQQKQIKAEEDFVNVISNFFAFEKKIRIEESRRREEDDRKRKGTPEDELY